MKRVFIAAAILFTVVLLAECQKDSSNTIVENTEDTRNTDNSGAETELTGTPGTIEAEMLPMDGDSPATKISFNESGSKAEFTWKKNDEFLMIVRAGASQGKYAEGTLNHYRFSASADGPSVSFSGTLPSNTDDGWYETNYAIVIPNGYGAWNSSTGCDFGYAYMLGNISGGVKVYMQGTAYNLNTITDGKRAIPMIGVKNGDKYTFHAATGVFKFTMNNWPEGGSYFYLDTVSPARLQGEYPIDSEGYIIMTAGGSDSFRQRYIRYDGTGGETVTFYMPIPIGTVPSGSIIKIADSSLKNILYQQTFATDVESKKNTMTEIAPLTYYALSDILGEYTTVVTASPYSSNRDTGIFKLEASDNGEKGNVMITMFAGVPGKMYGIYNPVNGTLTFGKDQMFATNPYSDSATWDSIVIVSYRSSAEDVTFKVTPSGKIKFTGVDIGFRATNETTWTSSYGGAYPWKLGYGSFVATKK